MKKVDPKVSKYFSDLGKRSQKKYSKEERSKRMSEIAKIRHAKNRMK